jgi:hypothetical protein
MAICDANLVDGMPKSLTAYGGLDALVHALESCVSVCATDYTKGEATLCSKYLKQCMLCAFPCSVYLGKHTGVAGLSGPCRSCLSVIPCVGLLSCVGPVACCCCRHVPAGHQDDL